jgi:hypothetical protein
MILLTEVVRMVFRFVIGCPCVEAMSADNSLDSSKITSSNEVLPIPKSRIVCNTKRRFRLQVSPLEKSTPGSGNSQGDMKSKESNVTMISGSMLNYKI